VIDNRGWAGNPWANGEDNLAGFFRPIGDDFRIFGAWTNHAHLPDKHIPKLRELIEFSLTQPGSHRRDACVVLRGDARAVVASWLFAHRTELEHIKFSAIFADAPAFIKNWPGRVAFDENGHENKDRRKQNQPKHRTDNIEDALECVG